MGLLQKHQEEIPPSPHRPERSAFEVCVMVRKVVHANGESDARDKAEEFAVKISEQGLGTVSIHRVSPFFGPDENQG